MNASEEPARAHVIVSGRVQGVWFRGTARQEALARGLSGWVRNRPDGTVEAVFEGTKGGAVWKNIQQNQQREVEIFVKLYIYE